MKRTLRLKSVFFSEKEKKMEELPLEVKIIGVAICIGAVVLLAAWGKIMEKLRGSSKPSKAK